MSLETFDRICNLTILAGLGFMWWENKHLQSIVQSMEQEKRDADIAAKAHGLSDAELDAFLIKDLSARTEPKKE